MTLEEFRAVTAQQRWRSYASSFIEEKSISADAVEHFGTYWIEGGHRIREQIADDPVLVRLLRHVLPAYDGEGLELYRGENRGRWDSGRIGLAWTQNLETARMFGSGLNAVGTGGVLLKGRFDVGAIISGLNRHSVYLGEGQFTVDPFASATISAVEFYPAVS